MKPSINVLMVTPGAAYISLQVEGWKAAAEYVVKRADAGQKILAVYLCPANRDGETEQHTVESLRADLRANRIQD